MALIENDEHFRLAAGQWLTDSNITGATVDAAGRKIYDSLNAEITPSQQVLETALDTALTGLENQAALDAAQVIADQAKVYFLSQLDAPGVPNLTAIFNTVQNAITDNPKMQQRMTRTTALIGGAMAWTVPLATSTDRGKQQYLTIAFIMIGMMG